MSHPFELPKLPYGYSDLEPYIDAQTMEIHHTKHHGTYVKKLNEILAKYPTLQNRPLEDLMKDSENLAMETADLTAFRNNGGGHLNHSLFWQIMGKEKDVDEGLMRRIKRAFGSIESFKKELTESALGRFGSGWAWLIEDEEGALKVYSTANQDSPYLYGHKPLAGLDVWEHAYYLKYQNRRAEYVENWWNILKII